MIATGDPPLNIYQEQANVVVSSRLYMIKGTFEENFSLIAELITYKDKYPFIYSIFNLPEEPNVIYVELRSAPPPSFTEMKLEPSKQFTKILHMLSKTTRFIPRQIYTRKFGRVKTGPYEGDPCEILGFNKDKVVIKVIPRVGKEPPSLIVVPESERKNAKNVTIEGLEYPCIIYNGMRIYNGFNILNVTPNVIRTWSAQLTLDELMVFIGIKNIKKIPKYIKKYRETKVPEKDEIIVSAIESDRLIEMENIYSRKAYIYASMGEVGHNILCGLDISDTFSNEKKAAISEEFEQKSAKYKKLGFYYQEIVKVIENVMAKERQAQKALNNNNLRNLYDQVKLAVDDLVKIKEFNPTTRKEFLQIDKRGALGFFSKKAHLDFLNDVTAESINDYSAICNLYAYKVVEFAEKFQISLHADPALPDESILSAFDYNSTDTGNDESMSDILSDDEGIVPPIDIEDTVPTRDEAQIDENETQIEENKIQIEENKTQIEENETQIEENETQIEENKAQIEENETKKEENERQIEENETQIEENETKKEENETQKEENETQIEENETQKDENETQKEENETQIEENQTQLEENILNNEHKEEKAQEEGENKAEAQFSDEESDNIPNSLIREVPLSDVESDQTQKVPLSPKEGAEFEEERTSKDSAVVLINSQPDREPPETEYHSDAAEEFIAASGEEEGGNSSESEPESTKRMDKANKKSSSDVEEISPAQKTSNNSQGSNSSKSLWLEEYNLVMNTFTKSYGIFLEDVGQDRIKVFLSSHPRSKLMKCVSWQRGSVKKVRDDQVQDRDGKDIEIGMEVSFLNDGTGKVVHMKEDYVYAVDKFGLLIKEHSEKAKIIDDDYGMEELPIVSFKNQNNVGAVLDEYETQYKVLGIDNKEHTWEKQSLKPIKLQEKLSVDKSFAFSKWDQVKVKIDGEYILGRVSAITNGCTLIYTCEKEFRWVPNNKIKSPETNSKRKQKKQIERESVKPKPKKQMETMTRSTKKQPKQLAIDEGEEEAPQSQSQSQNQSQSQPSIESSITKEKAEETNEINYPSSHGIGRIPQWMRRSALVKVDGIDCIVDVVEHWNIIVRPVLDGIIQPSEMRIEVGQATPLPVVAGCRVYICAGATMCRGTVLNQDGTSWRVKVDSIVPTKPITVPSAHLIRIFDPVQY